MLTVLTSEHFQPEKEYIFHVLLHEMLGLEYVVEFAGGGLHVLRLPNGAELKIEDWFAAMELPESLSRFSGSENCCPPPAFHFTNEPTSRFFFHCFLPAYALGRNLEFRTRRTWAFPRSTILGLETGFSPPPDCERMGRLALGSPGPAWLAWRAQTASVPNFNKL